MDAKCKVTGCENQAHARGYCRKHYRQVWLKGKIRSEEEERWAVEKSLPRNESDRLRAMERELRRAETMYRNVLGVEGRLRWRRELEAVKKEMVRLGGSPANSRAGIS